MKELRAGEEAVVVIERCLVLGCLSVFSLSHSASIFCGGRYLYYYSSMTGIRPDSGQVIVLIFYLADVPTLGS